MSVPMPSLPEADRLIERAEMRLEQYRISLAMTADAVTQDTVQRLEEAIVTLRGFINVLREDAHQ